MASNQAVSRDRGSDRLRDVADRFIDALDLRDAVDGATKAADESNLPQGEGGPADAYRHLLIVGELKRRFGPLFGEALATTYEFMNDLGGQSELNRRMDDVNNEAALDGPDLRTFEISSAGHAARSARPRHSTATAWRAA